MREERWQSAITLLQENSSLVEKHWELLWNLGWCYFKLERRKQALRYMALALELAPNRSVCKFGLGQVYLKLEQYKKAEHILLEAVQQGLYAARTGLALAYLAQGKLDQAERIHLESIDLRPRKSEPYESYAAFLSDVGREAEAVAMTRKAKQLHRLH